MKDPRPWIALFGLITFLVGAGAGILFIQATTDDAPSRPFDEYEARLAQEFELSPARRAHLRVILREYDADINRISRAHRSAYYASLQSDLRPKGIEYNGYIRDKVLRLDQRAHFDELTQGVSFASDLAHR